MIELGNRANVLVFPFRGKHIIVYEDHRYILNVLHFAHENRLIDKDINIVRFDRHADYVDVNKSALEMIRGFHRTPPNQREFWQFVEFDVAHSDDDWVKVAYELDYIKNSVVFNNLDNQNSSGTYENKTNGSIHNTLDLGSLTDAFTRSGALSDKGCWASDEFDWFNTETNAFIHPLSKSCPSTPYILDFDLDAFAAKTNWGTFAYPQEIMLNNFQNSIYMSDYLFGKEATPEQLIKKFVENSSFITICLETVYCGGFQQTNNILRVLDYMFFDGAIYK